MKGLGLDERHDHAVEIEAHDEALQGFQADQGFVRLIGMEGKAVEGQAVDLGVTDAHAVEASDARRRHPLPAAALSVVAGAGCAELCHRRRL